MRPFDVADEMDESRDRELFARRAQALGEAGVPPLGDILRAAARPEPRAARGPSDHAWVQLLGGAGLAAAVMLGAVRSLPSAAPAHAASVAAAVDAGAGSTEPAGGASWSTFDDPAACTMEPAETECANSCGLSSEACASEGLQAADPPLACENDPRLSE